MKLNVTRLAFSFLIAITAGTLSATARAADSLVPKVAFDYWNEGGVVSVNNCYNYGTNRRTDSFAQPGEASGQEYTALTCQAVYAAAGKDLGLIPSAFSPFKGKEDDLLVALVVAPGYDFHWYRRGDDNMWTHKMGGTPATNLDNSGRPITSPEKANRGSYTDFCGYFRIKNRPTLSNEQNGGIVRIGNMQKLPELVRFHARRESSVQMLIYSGRANPSLSLHQVVKYINIPVLRELAAHLKAQRNFGAELNFHPREFFQLGYRGVQITDREGLMFPVGTELHLRGDVVYISHEGQSEIRWVKIPGLALIEEILVAEFGKNKN